MLNIYCYSAGMPENRYFTEAMLDVLLNPVGWRFVASFFREEAAPVDDPRHLAWSRENAHSHPHQEALVILAGEGRLGIDGVVYPTAPGTVFCFDAFQPHDLNVPPWSPDADHLWLFAMPDHIGIRLLSVRNGSVDWNGACSYLRAWEETGLAEQRSLFHAGNAACPPSLQRMRALATLSLLIGGMIEAGYAPAEVEDRESFQARVVHTIRRYIEETAGNGASLEQLARIAGYSKFHFLRLFRRHTGQTIHAYINECRLRRVHEMQRRGASQKEIAYALGFSCPSAFSRWCRGHE